MKSEHVPITITIVALAFLAVAEAGPPPTESHLKIQSDFAAFQRFIEEEAAWKEAACRRQMARSAAERRISEEFDITRYDLDLEVFPETKQIAGSVRLTAQVLAPAETLWLNFSSLRFLSFGMYVDGVAGDAVDWTHGDDLLTLALDRPYAPGERVEVIVSYHGSPYQYLHTFFDNHGGVPLISTLSEPFDARSWWPCKDQPDDKADTVCISVVVPSDLVVASNGSLIEASAVDYARTRYTWLETYPIATYLVSLAITNYTVFDRWYVATDHDSLLLQLFLWPENVATADTVFSKIEASLRAFTPLFGPYPFLREKYAHAQYRGFAMENQTCTSIGSGLGAGTVHELAHQWWGDMITCESFHHIWLNEGFATYSEALWAEATGGEEAYRQALLICRYLGPGTIYVEDLTISEIFAGGTSYFKPAYVLHMLRHVMGDSLFFVGLRHYRDLHEYSSATTEDFQHAMEDIHGDDLSWFFQEWIYWEFFPRYDYGWLCEASGPLGWTTTVVVRQVQTNTGLFTMPVDLRVTLEDSSQVTQVLWVESAADTFLVQTARPVVGVELDPDDWVLCEKRLISLDAMDMPFVQALTIEGPWPNPASCTARLLVRLLEPGRVGLYDLGGRLLLRERIDAGSRVWTVPTLPLPNGTYVIRIETPSSDTQRRLVIVR